MSTLFFSIHGEWFSKVWYWKELPLFYFIDMLFEMYGIECFVGQNSKTLACKFWHDRIHYISLSIIICSNFVQIQMFHYIN